MSDKYVREARAKSEVLAEVINRTLQQIGIKCTKGNQIRDYFYVGVIGYGSAGAKPVFAGHLAGRGLVPISELAGNPIRIGKTVYNNGTEVKYPIWFEPLAYGGTPMVAAFKLANELISIWLGSHQNCFPPIIIHITDGESTDGNPTVEMRKLSAQTSTDGNVILFNLHTHAQGTNSISFPGSKTSLPEEYAEILYNGASPLPGFIREVAVNEHGLNISHDAKAFVMNGDIDLIIKAMDIGTRHIQGTYNKNINDGDKVQGH
ncbi:hypothetical protein FACS189435_3370 [Bacteroidia bacterium]|nr:hypothetical protein FACS189435_3370 [Bacteroidia bacterium]